MQKKFMHLSLLTAALTLTACSSDSLQVTSQDVVAAANQGDNSIQFGTYVGNTAETRGIVGKTGAITTAKLQEGTSTTDGFGVFAYYTNATPWDNNQDSFNANFMYNQHVTANGTSDWTYTPLKYWPNDFAPTPVDNQTTDAATGSVAGGKVSFFAYAPYVAAAGTASDDGIIGITGNTVKGAPKITYKLPTDPSESNIVDLLWGMRGGAYNQAPTGAEAGSATGYNINLTKQTVSEKVNFLFKHALARLGGSATTGNHGGIWVALDLDHIRTSTGNSETKDPATLVTVKGIKIENGEEAPTSYSFKKQGDFNLATGEWSNLSTDYAISDEVKYDDSPTKLNNTIAEPTSGLTNDGTTGWKVSDTPLEGVTTNLKQMYSGKDSYYLIPSTSDQKLKITITYVVRTYDPNLDNSGKKWSEVEQKISKIVTFTDGLDSNKIYRLNLYLGLTSVKFTATVSNWSPDSSSGNEGEELEEVDLPINVDDAP